MIVSGEHRNIVVFVERGEGGFDVDGVCVLVRCGEIAQVGKLRICFML